jgi:type VI secretion system secreted protein Hcp
MWLFVSKDCPGEATDEKHKDKIDVESWKWGMAHPVSIRAKGRSEGETTVQDVSVTKRIDKATPILMQYCLNGKHLEEVVLIARKRGQDPIDYLTVKLKKAIISSLHPSRADEGGAMETLTINCEEIEVAYQPQGSDGKADGGPVTMKWNLLANKAG